MTVHSEPHKLLCMPCKSIKRATTLPYRCMQKTILRRGQNTNLRMVPTMAALRVVPDRGKGKLETI